MIWTINICKYFCILDVAFFGFWYKKIVQPPTNILFPGFEPVGPPGIFFFIRMQKSIRINKAGITQCLEFFSFLFCESCIVYIGFWILYIKGCCSNIEIPTNNNGFFLYRWFVWWWCFIYITTIIYINWLSIWIII